MKRCFQIFFITIGILLFAGCDSKSEVLVPDNSELIPNSYYAYSNNECTNLSELYFEDNNYTYYKVCLDYIELDFKDTKLIRNLKDSILTDETSLEDLINNSNNKEKYGKYNIYFYDNFNLAIDNDNIYLIYEKIDYKNYLDSLEKH